MDKCKRILIYIVLCVFMSGYLVGAACAEGTNIVLSMSGYKQTTSYTCGSASSLMVLYYLGAKRQLEDDGITNDKKFHDKYRKDTATAGIQIPDIITGLNKYLGSGTYTYNYYVSSESELISLVTQSLSCSLPVIASVYWYGGHYVVIYGITYENGKAYFKIKDPVKAASETVTKSVSDFYASMPYPNRPYVAHPIVYGTKPMNHDPYLNISGAAYPSGKITANQSFELKGKITSNETITSVYGSIYFLKDNTLVPKSTFSTNVNPAVIHPNTTSVEIYNTEVNTGLKFGQLPEEAYRYELSAVTSSGYSKTLVDSVFTVGSFVLSTGVSMSQSDLSMNVGQTVSLSASISPSNATKKTIEWYSNDPSVATVDSNGNVTGISAGTADIIAETVDGSNTSAYCTVQVKQLSGKWGKLKWSINGSGVLTISGTGAMQDFDLWDNSSAWRPYASTINEVVLKSGVTSIGNFAFSGCNLASVTIPDNIESIGFTAFYCCDNLTSISIPASVTNIGSWAFGSCTNLSSVTLNANLNAIWEYTFYGCGSLSSITLPTGITSIGEHAFESCSGLIYLGIPSAVTKIGENAFSYCDGLKCVYIPSSVNSIADSAFEETNNVSVYCYDGSKAQTFANRNGVSCYLLDTPYSNADFILPNNLQTIEDQAFAGIKAKRVRLNETVTAIGNEAFAGCTGMIQVYIPASCTSIAASAFSSVNGLTIYGESGSYAETYAIEKGFVFAGSDSLITRIRLYILNISSSFDSMLDFNKDGKIDSMDYVIARKIGL